ncbi:hypothetical protein HCN44_009912 [Aphidius gifuensis]|uniref:Uncharacterized protein n=1 Tax=Aphidius gifuensis TaxID=684658 RepID=A0A834Y407_APHGI|nr:hypothetical protein HCN44_009912 [Aphidius gifuensis]
MNNIEYTSNEEFDSFQVGDNSVVVTGAIISTEPVRNRTNPGKQPVLRCVLSNMEGRQLRVLIWNSRIPEFEGRISHQMVRLTRPRVMRANPQFFDASLNLMEIELFVQDNTRVDLLGTIPAAPVAERPLPLYELRDIGNITGPVRLTAFIRYPIERQVVGNYSYGSGAITDGVYHSCINVAGPHKAIPAGTHVVVSGELRRNNYDTLILQVTDTSQITIADDQMMDARLLRASFRVIPRDTPRELHPAVGLPVLRQQMVALLAQQVGPAAQELIHSAQIHQLVDLPVFNAGGRVQQIAVNNGTSERQAGASKSRHEPVILRHKNIKKVPKQLLYASDGDSDTGSVGDEPTDSIVIPDSESEEEETSKRPRYDLFEDDCDD